MMTIEFFKNKEDYLCTHGGWTNADASSAHSQAERNDPSGSNLAAVGWDGPATTAAHFYRAHCAPVRHCRAGIAVACCCRTDRVCGSSALPQNHGGGALPPH